MKVGNPRPKLEFTSEKVESAGRPEVLKAVPEPHVLKALSAILESPPFHASAQSRELLRYIVGQTLANHLDMLKERMIGAHVFGRRMDYATSDDPIVRARVAEVRKRLALYYQKARDESVRISIPSGSFKAVFEWADRNQVQVQPVPHPGLESIHPAVDLNPSSTPLEASGKEPLQIFSKSRRHMWWIGIAATVAISIFASVHYFPSAEARAFNQFWSPILNNPHATLIYIGGNAVYQLSPSYLATYYREHSRSRTEEMGYESYIPFPPGTKIDGQDLVPAKDTFITIGDVAAITKVESLLLRRNRQFNIRYGGDVAYGDLRESPTILIGAHNNSWTLSVTENLRYVFDGPSGIVDRSDSRKHWSATASFAEDYAIVSRILNSKTGTTVIAAAGVGYAGTQAAAEFLTNPQSVAALVKSLPNGWEKKNIQIVLHTSVTNQLPGPPDVVATYCW